MKLLICLIVLIAYIAIVLIAARVIGFNGTNDE